MHDFSHMLRVAPTFEHPEIADLSWVIGSCPLMKHSTQLPFQVIGEEWCLDQWMTHLPWLIDLDKDPSPLHEFLDANPQKLLGKKFEQLLHFWLLNHSDFEIVHVNHQIKREQQTLGEIDFLVHYKPDDLFWHLESACKYYIGVRNNSHQRYWIGPNGRDSLHEKWQTLKRQLRLLDTPEGKTFFAQPTERFLFMKGYFFQPFRELGRFTTPQQAHPHHRGGWYMTFPESKFLSSNQAQWHILSHDRWMSLWQWEIQKPMTGDELAHQLFTSPQWNKQAQLVVQCLDGKEISRGFIIPESVLRG